MKNIKMAVVAILLVAVAVTTYSVGGTYAKYTTTLAEQTDSARVAKWKIGQTTDIENLFKSSYAATDKTDKNAVVSTVDVVAPGTKGEYTFSLNGTVETNYTIVATVNATDTINTQTYAPIKYKLDGTDITDLNSDGIVNAKDLALAITNIYSANKVYAAGTVSESEHKVEWAWDIDGTDTEDTKLGNEIVENEDSHKVSLSVTITATQSQLAAN